MSTDIQYQRILAECDVGSGLSEEEVSAVLALAQVVSVRAGETILRQFDAADAVFLPCSGMILVERSALNGRRQVIDFLRRGDYLGFTATDNYLYSATALEPGTVLRFPRQRFEDACDHIPTLKENLAKINNLVLAGLLDHLFAIGQKRAHERLAFLIHQLQLREHNSDSRQPLALPMNRSDIGDYLGLTLETTSRAFSRLRKEGVISTPDHHSVIVENQEQLDELAEVD
ncbi:Crp/Fnr family transcriptional regulator [Halioglobus maricola]|uniref:Crp/Fnr family transcriptional regulator n=1 Tax=Halioglobus maricola TaxID=2601894 RepID=A0A5P9NI79_9GAMM|nr:Crp/Fnr family transcriptional regulator [Halioglobus maricola]QFU75537.1 Crp/Fnr family transcriptional regulator [Halioglobus maricola]